MPSKGIFCLEGLWHEDLQRGSTVEPILNMLQINGGVSYIRQDVATVEELEFYLRRWRLARYRGYPILYLAFHGNEQALLIGDTVYPLDRLSEVLEGSCSGTVLIMASCSTLNTDRRNIKRFLRKTGALAVCGYRNKVGWMLAAAFEILVLSSLQDIEFSGRGIWAMERRVKDFNHYFGELDFTFVTRRELRSPGLMVAGHTGTLMRSKGRSRPRRRSARRKRG